MDLRRLGAGLLGAAAVWILVLAVRIAAGAIGGHAGWMLLMALGPLGMMAGVLADRWWAVLLSWGWWLPLAWVGGLGFMGYLWLGPFWVMVAGCLVPLVDDGRFSPEHDAARGGVQTGEEAGDGSAVQER